MPLMLSGGAGTKLRTALETNLSWVLPLVQKGHISVRERSSKLTN